MKKTLFLLLLISSFALSGCGRQDPISKTEVEEQGINIGSIPDVGNLRDVSVASLDTAAEVGALAPEITGKDSAGTEFSLSDYRGQVVMLDFWGNW